MSQSIFDPPGPPDPPNAHLADSPAGALPGDEPAVAAAATYRWTPIRILLGLLIVGGVAGFLTFHVYQSYAGSASSPRVGGRARGPRPLPGPRASLEQFNIENLLLPDDQILGGGPAKDGIPALTDPKTVAGDAAEVMFGPTARIIAVTVNGQTRGYPINILNWHEAVNDTLGQTPIGVIYCPLCDSVTVVDRRLDDKTYEFGISGLLCYSNVLLYDRTDNALWSQVGLKAVSGPNAGRSLTHLDGWSMMHLTDFRAQYPDAQIVSIYTGHRRMYRGNPYQPYFNDDKVMASFKTFEPDTRMKNKARIIGIAYKDVARAYPLDAIRKSPGGEVLDELAGEKVQLKYDEQRDVFDVIKVPDGANAVHTFWFTWAKFHEDTQIYGRTPGAR